MSNKTPLKRQTLKTELNHFNLDQFSFSHLIFITHAISLTAVDSPLTHQRAMNLFETERTSKQNQKIRMDQGPKNFFQDRDF